MSQSAGLDPFLVNPLRRPEVRPRKASSAVVKARPIVLRTALTLVLGAAAFTFAGRVVAIAAEPVIATYQTGQEIRQLQASLKDEAARNAQLRQDIAYLQTPAGVEQEARLRGWVRPGEVALAFEIPDKEPESLHLAERPSAPRQVAVADRIRAAVDTCLAVFGERTKTE